MVFGRREIERKMEGEKSGGVKSIEKMENDRKDLSFSYPSGEIKK